jgi:transcriptional regulator with XRE-family HTH domain
MNIGKIIKEIRTKKDLTQEELASKSSIKQTTISQIENGRKRPNRSSMKKICKALGVSESMVFLLATEAEDIPKPRKEMYDLLFPSVRNLMMKILLDEDKLASAK